MEPFTMIRRPLFKIALFNFDFTVWHYALYLPYINKGKHLTVNFGPQFLFFLFNRAVLRFEFYEDYAWEPAAGLYWEQERPSIYEIQERFEPYRKWIETCIRYDGTVKPMRLDEYYDLDDNNCEHFCSNIIYGRKFSSQTDAF